MRKAVEESPPLPSQRNDLLHLAFFDGFDHRSPVQEHPMAAQPKGNPQMHRE